MLLVMINLSQHTASYVTFVTVHS